jgi:hypothetical protein
MFVTREEARIWSNKERIELESYLFMLRMDWRRRLILCMLISNKNWKKKLEYWCCCMLSHESEIKRSHCMWLLENKRGFVGGGSVRKGKWGRWEVVIVVVGVRMKEMKSGYWFLVYACVINRNYKWWGYWRRVGGVREGKSECRELFWFFSCDIVKTLMWLCNWFG